MNGPASYRLHTIVISFCAGCLVLLGGCHQADSPSAVAEASVTTAQSAVSETNQIPMFNGRPLFTGPHRTPKGMRGLGIAGYNYTDTYIDSFAVNGAGGGNLEVSDGQSGGGKVTCCASLADDMLLPLTVEISWQRDGNAPLCKQTVLLDGPVPVDPNYLEVHFYQDGTIQLAITNYPSPARLILQSFNRLQRKADGNVNNDRKYSECKHGR